MVTGLAIIPFYTLRGAVNGLLSKKNKNLLSVVTGTLKGATNGQVVSHLTGWKMLLSSAFKGK